VGQASADEPLGELRRRRLAFGRQERGNRVGAGTPAAVASGHGSPLVVGASRGGIPLDDLGQEPGGVVLDLDAYALDPAQDLSVQVGVVVSDLGLEDGAMTTPTGPAAGDYPDPGQPRMMAGAGC